LTVLLSVRVAKSAVTLGVDSTVTLSKLALKGWSASKPRRRSRSQTDELGKS
jgi:hypothetical protein